MAKHVGIYEMRAKLGELVRAASSGETIIVDVRGRPAAKLVPFHDEAGDAVAWFKRSRAYWGALGCFGARTYRGRAPLTTVIDASAALAWCMPDEFDAEADALLRRVDEGATIVPSLWLYEMENAFRSALRRKRISERDAHELLAKLSRLPIRVVDVPERPAFFSAFDIAVRHDISVYDAVYLDVAKRHRAELASRDARLLSIADALNIPRFTVSE